LVVAASGVVGVVIERDAQLDFDLPAAYSDLFDDEADELLALLEVEFVDASGRLVGKVGDPPSEMVIGGKLMALSDERVVLLAEFGVASVEIACSALDFG
jgi:hypothetical protein